MTQQERFEQMYHSGKHSSLQAMILFSVVIVFGCILLMIGDRNLAELLWFVLSAPVILFVKIVARTNTLLRFNASSVYKRLVWLEFWFAIGLIMIYCLLVLTMLLNPRQYNLSVVMAGVYVIGWIASSKIDQKLAKIDSEHVTHKVYEQGKIGFFIK